MTDYEILPQTALIPASDYVIIGGTGDLALRKIFPALLARYAAGQVTDDFRLYVVSRQKINAKTFRSKLVPHCQLELNTINNGDLLLDSFMALINFVGVDITADGGMDLLASDLLTRAEASRPIIFYLSIASSLFKAACLRIDESGLTLPQSRLVVEKPLGHDRGSAEEINNELRNVFKENQIYRIDHYLGKETVQNLMALRFANVIFEALWNNRYIDHVQITVAETVGVGNRAKYYDKYGAMRDMLQNHLLQLLCLVAMEPPARFNADQVRNEKLRVLNAIRAVEADDFILGQYDEYISEIGEATSTETYVAMKLLVDNWRWAGVPFYLRTGKKMTIRASEIIITFKDRPHDIFAHNGITDHGNEIPNRLVIRVQPNEGLRLMLTSKEPGPGGMRLFPSELYLSFDKTFSQRLPEAYERLLMDIARGNQTLFMRLDEVLESWRLIDPVVKMAAKNMPVLYPSGSMGPDDNLMTRDGREWLKPKDESDDTA